MKLIFNTFDASSDRLFTPPTADVNPYEISVLQFCQQWLKDPEDLTVKTSGSTGLPNTILLSRKVILSSVYATAQALSLSTDDVALLCLDISYIAGKMMAIRAMEIGVDLVVVPPSSYPIPHNGQRQITFAAFVPLQLQTLMQSKAGIDFVSGIKTILVGGAPISSNLIDQLQPLPCQVYHTYGMTETVSHIALKKLNGPDASKSFRILPGIEIQQDGRGCLMVKGGVTNNKWITTNDLVEIHNKENFTWLGRADNVINSGGIKISPEVIEEEIGQVLDTFGVQRSFFVGPMANGKLGQQVCLFIEGSPLGKAVEIAVLEKLSNNLQKHTSPKSIQYLHSFVYVNNKIQRSVTLQRFLNTR